MQQKNKTQATSTLAVARFFEQKKKVEFGSTTH
jgi:hypothetical protein